MKQPGTELAQHFGHQGLLQYDHTNVLGHIQKSAETTRQIQIDAINENLQRKLGQGDIGLLGSNVDAQFEMQALKAQVADLTKRVQDVKGERDQTLDKFEQNEIMWASRAKKTQLTSKSLLDMNQGLKDDNQELMMQVDKYIKRVRQVENEVEREKENSRATELKLHDERRNVQNL